MIRIYLGDDTETARKTARAAFEDARSADSTGNTVYFDDVLFDLPQAIEGFSAESLFGGQNILYFDGILDHPDGETFYRTILRETSHKVFVREKDPSKDLTAFFGRLGEVVEYKIAKKIEKRENSFAIADAIGARNKKAAWVEYEKTRKRGVSIEEVHGTVFWAFKSMYIAGVLSQSEASKAGMKEYTYRNYSQFSKKYLHGEILHRLTELKEMYHKGHRGEVDMEQSMELLLLDL